MNIFAKFKEKPKVSIFLLSLFIITFTVTGVYFIYKSLAVSTIDALSAELYSPSGKSIERISGPDRYSTAVGISKKQFPTSGGGTVIIASGENWPDSASGAVLARTFNAPILLNPATSFNIYTKNELARIRPTRVIIIGGTTTISSSVETAIKSLLPNSVVERIAGVDRYETAAKVAAWVFNANGRKINDNTAFVVTGSNFPDVLSASAVAAAKGYPLLFAGTTYPTVTKNVITAMGIKRTIVVGGTAVIPDSVKNQMPGAIRVAGSTRYTTAIAINNWALTNLPGFALAEIGIASGENFPDALAAGPYIASRTTPGLLLLTTFGLHTDTYNYLSARKGSLKYIYVFGGDTVVSSSAYMKLANLIGYGFTSSQISAQTKLDQRIKLCPLLSASTVDYSYNTYGYQAVAYYMSGRILINPTHTASLDTIINHEIYHIYDWRDNGVINWGESFSTYSSVPDCTP